MFFRALFFHLSLQLHHAGRGGGRKFCFRHKLLSLDSPVITLCLNLFPWAEYTRTKGGVKLHLLLDHDGYWPTYAVVSDAKTSNVSVARRLALPRGSVVVIDRGYLDYALWGRWARDDGIYFVTRLKSNTPYRVLETHPVPPSKGARILLDQTIQLTSTMAKRACPYRLRRIVARDPETGSTVVLLTNHEKLAAPHGTP